MGKGNNIIPNGHFHKDWQKHVKTTFNQPARKFRRKQNRVKKAHALAPRPVNLLRPVVHCPSVRYHTKVRAGRGFTLEELKASGLNKNFAKTIGISIDSRRRSKSVQALQLNAQRLKEYGAKLILFPKNSKKPQKGDSTEEECNVATQVKGEIMPERCHAPAKASARAITEGEKKFSAFVSLRQARADERLVGVRAKRVKDVAENPGDITKDKKDKN